MFCEGGESVVSAYFGDRPGVTKALAGSHSWLSRLLIPSTATNEITAITAIKAVTSPQGTQVILDLHRMRRQVPLWSYTTLTRMPLSHTGALYLVQNICSMAF